MREYDPFQQPECSEWESLDEQERLDLVKAHHRATGTDLPDENMHAIVHVIVENQIALGDETPVNEVHARLMEEGLDRHDAIHAVGSALAAHLYDILGGVETPGGSDNYYEELKRLSAAGWLSSGNGSRSIS